MAYLDSEKIDKRQMGLYVVAFVSLGMTELVPGSIPLAMLLIIFYSILYALPITPKKQAIARR